MQNGELEGIKPKLVVLLIGTNNGADSKEDVALGITTIVKEILKRASGTKVLLLGIFPRNKPSDASRIKNNQVNEIISKLDDGGKTVKFMDIGETFLDADKLCQKRYARCAAPKRQRLPDLGGCDSADGQRDDGRK